MNNVDTPTFQFPVKADNAVIKFIALVRSKFPNLIICTKLICVGT